MCVSVLVFVCVECVWGEGLITEIFSQYPIKLVSLGLTFV